MDEASAELFDAALKVLHGNDRGRYIMPNSSLYPHQWLWDSCFIAIGLRHLDVGRAQTEIESLLAGQWANGMLPHIIFDSNPKYTRDHNRWQSWISPHAPNGIITSGLTQPPMVAEAVTKIGKKMKPPERRSWYAQTYPRLLAYHQWLYLDRSTKNGLVAVMHPYETGMDDSPPIVHELREHAWPWWLSLLEFSKLDKLIGFARTDTRELPSSQRITDGEAIAEWALLRKLRNKSYDSRTILGNHPRFGLEDLAFNCIFIRANHCLAEIAKTIGKSLPSELAEDIRRTEQALEELWDEQTCRYYGRCLSGDSIFEATISTLLPLYAGCITKSRAEELVRLMKKRTQFRANFPLPSVPTASHSFDPNRYWQGPVWINTNWLVIEGLLSYGFKEDAEELRKKTIQMISKNGCSEYFNPNNGQPLGAPNFSWTAALAIDLMQI